MTRRPSSNADTADYRTVLRRLTTLDDEAAAQRAEAARWHDDRVAAADEAVRAADERCAAAAAGGPRGPARPGGGGRAGRRALVGVRAQGGPVAERFGRTVPQPAIPRQRGDRDAEDYLDEVATRSAYTRRPGR